MLNSHFSVFQVSTKEVIKFQMVGWSSFSVWKLLPGVTVCRFSWFDLLDVILRHLEHYLLSHDSLSSMNELSELLIMNLNSSFQAYSNLLRAHMDGLKKKDKKSKSKKTKATQWASDSLTQPWVPKLACTIWGNGKGLHLVLTSLPPEASESLFILLVTALIIMPLFAW